MHESRDAALALCNLGFENWPAVRNDRRLTTTFQIGLAFLHHNVCMRTARRLLDVVMILDTPAWGTLVGLTDECPVLDGQLISSAAQLAAVHRFLDNLPAALVS